ncbi:hypothetical protein EZV62_016624 [Acer yangbiense]|uniref:Alkyl transferase n=1 Tax=Acer yangbiense TaxID=1000413 RepID=A0A5C7HPV7_9ROSI|nr:hypothetical protein EZV62_016624 [Acer yangbiense]
MGFSLQVSLPPPPPSPPPTATNTATFTLIRPVTNLRFKPPLCASTQQQLVVSEENELKSINGAPEENVPLPLGLRRESIPRHVAVIMDGNRRWARLRGLPVDSGYEAGVKSLRTIVELCCKWGIPVLTVFAFSSDNWFRPKVSYFFPLKTSFKLILTDDRDNIRISVIGDLSKLPKSLVELIRNVEETTKNNTRFQLIVAVSYSGKYDLVQACQRIAMKVKDGVIEPSDINESLIEQQLETNCTEFPYPDLLIRTSGELRISNFLLWQLVYTELFFAQSLWPDFGEAEFIEALRSFQRRRRSYGG